MTNHNLVAAVERASSKLLEHFKEQYGSLIFIPLGVGAKTPAKIAPGIAKSVEEHLLSEKEEKLQLLVQEEKVQIVFDTFVDAFFNSLNFIAKGIMKTLGMKLEWKKFKQEMFEAKSKKPQSYEMWKKNLLLVLQGVFSEVITELEANGKIVELTD